MLDHEQDGPKECPSRGRSTVCPPGISPSRQGEVVLRIVLHSPQVVPMLLSPAPLQGQGCGDELAVLGEGEAGHLVDLVVG